MRILTVIQNFYPTLAGAEKFGQALAEGLLRKGHPQIILTARWDRTWNRSENLNGLSVMRHPVWWIGNRRTRLFAGITYMIVLFYYLVKLRSHYDVMLVHQAQKGAFIASLVGRLFGKPTAVIVHCAGRFGDIEVMRSSEFGFYTSVMINTIKNASAFIAICSDIEMELRAEGFERIRMIHDGIVPWDRTNKRDYSRSERLVTLARLHPQKGLDILITALGIQHVRKSAWTLDIFGEGPERDRLTQLAYDLGLSDRISFRGVVSHVDEVLDSSDIFVLPSRGEGMGIALLEAMYAGLPCVVTRVSGFVDIIEHEKNGYLVAPENPTDLAEAIGQMLVDGPLRRRLGIAARSTVLERFTLGTAVDRYEDLLSSLVGDHMPRES